MSQKSINPFTQHLLYVLFTIQRDVIRMRPFLLPRQVDGDGLVPATQAVNTHFVHSVTPHNVAQEQLLPGSRCTFSWSGSFYRTTAFPVSCSHWYVNEANHAW